MTENPFETVALAELLNREEQQVLARKLFEVMQRGFGEITIVIQRGHPRLIIVKNSEVLPGPKK